MSSDPNHKAPISLQDLAAGYKGLISLSTLSHHVKGLPSAQEAGRLCTKLKTEEEEMLVKHLKEQAALGFPYIHRGITEVANSILWACCEREHLKFQPLGKQWSARFVLKENQDLLEQCLNMAVLEARNML